MLILLYLLIVFAGLALIVKAISSEAGFDLKLSSFKFPEFSLPRWGSVKLKKDVITQFGSAYPSKPKAPEPVKPQELDVLSLPVEPLHSYGASAQPPKEPSFGKLESLLTEKNLEIGSLQEKLKALQRQEQEFDKVRSILEDELKTLREQNRTLKSELSLMAPVQPSNTL